MTANFIAPILAMGQPPNPNQPAWAQAMSTMMPIVLIFVVFYFMLIRPEQKRRKETQKLIESLRSGDKIITSGGILGTVTNVKEKTVIVRIADNAKIEMLRSAVQTVTQRGEGDSTPSKN